MRFQAWLEHLQNRVIFQGEKITGNQLFLFFSSKCLKLVTTEGSRLNIFSSMFKTYWHHTWGSTAIHNREDRGAQNKKEVPLDFLKKLRGTTSKGQPGNVMLGISCTNKDSEMGSEWSNTAKHGDMMAGSWVFELLMAKLSCEQKRGTFAVL